MVSQAENAGTSPAVMQARRWRAGARTGGYRSRSRRMWRWTTWTWLRTTPQPTRRTTLRTTRKMEVCGKILGAYFAPMSVY